MRLKSCQSEARCVPFLNTDVVSGISKMVPQEPRPMILRSSRCTDDRDAKVEVWEIADLVEN